MPPLGASGGLAARFTESLVVHGALYAAARLARQRALTSAGLAHAAFLGVLLAGCVGWGGWGLSTLFFLVGTLATRVGARRKEALGIAEARGGARAPANVWGAAGVGALCALAAAVAEAGGRADLVRLARAMYVCAIAAKMSDTLASEIGKAYGTHAFLVTSLERVPPGTEGAVSVQGTVAGVAGSVLAVAYSAAVGLAPGVKMWAVVVVAAFVATTAESFIGVLAQGKYELSNEFVNFLNTLIAAVVGGCLWGAVGGGAG